MDIKIIQRLGNAVQCYGLALDLFFVSTFTFVPPQKHGRSIKGDIGRLYALGQGKRKKI